MFISTTRLKNLIRLTVVLLFILGFISKTLFAQDSVIPAANADIVIPGLPLNQVGYLRIASDINNVFGNAITGVVIEEQNALGFPNQFRFVLYNGIISNVMTITPASLTIGLQTNSSPYPMFNLMFYPDIVLVKIGTNLKAIITFDTDDTNFGAYWVEYDINPTTLVASQNTFSFGGCVPLTHAYLGSGSNFSHLPRVDRSNNGVSDIFAVVAMQDVNNNTEIPVITYFEDNGSSFQFNTTLIYQPAIGSIGTNNYYNPDIAIGWDQTNSEICCAVSYVEDNVLNPNSYSVQQVEYKPSNPSLYTSNYSNTISTFYPFSPFVINPRICAPPIFNTSPTNDIPFGLCYSNSPLQLPWSNGNLYYAHYSSTGLNTLKPDAQNAYATSYNGEPVIEYMQDTPGNTAREACMAWSAMLNVSGTIKYGIYALMDPFVNLTFYDWSQVNFNPINTSTNIRYCTAIAGTWDNGMDRYVIAWLADNILSLKIRNVHVANYKSASSLGNVNIEIYPNPAKNKINLIAPGNITYAVYNVMGVLMNQGRTQESGLTELNTQTLNNGVYFIKTESKTTTFTINRY